MQSKRRKLRVQALSVARIQHADQKGGDGRRQEGQVRLRSWKMLGDLCCRDAEGGFDDS